MAIDIRADVTCNLGELISASINDDYIQGNGLVKYTGSCQINDIITPAIGTVVTFTYNKSEYQYEIPRKLRVLSSFADPFRRVTTIQLGCMLTYMQDLKQEINWSAYDDPQNSNYTQGEDEIVTIPIHASSVMNKCLEKIGITSSSNPLTNKFSISSFDFSSGYVQVLSDLLLSESYCGFLDANEVLQIFSLDQTGGIGPVITSQQLIDISQINVGQLPGEAVTVSYSSLRLKQPEGAALDTQSSSGDLWDRSVSTETSSALISYTKSDGTSDSRVYKSYKTEETTTAYSSILLASGEQKRVTQSRTVETIESSINTLGSMASARLSAGAGFSNYTIQSTAVETFEYDKNGNESFRQKTVYGDPEYIVGSLPVPWVVTGATSNNYVAIPSIDSVYLSREITRSSTINGSSYNGTAVSTATYSPWSQSVWGQQAIAEARDSFTTIEFIQSFLNFCCTTELVLDRTSSNISQAGVNQEAPGTADLNNSRNSSNPYSTESKSQLELAIGSATAQRVTQFSMPYAPDDVFIRSVEPPLIVYRAQKSDAVQKANKFGRVQNKLLLGNRNGISLQSAAEILPSDPFSPIIVQANGLSALYRTNGTTWTIDPRGIIVSTDALFWGAIGGTGNFWFPVAPGVTELPETPPVIDGEMTVENIVEPWNETLIATSIVKTGLQVQGYNYLLGSISQPEVSITLHTKLEITKAPIPVAVIEITCHVPIIDTPISVPTSIVGIQQLMPTVLTDTIISPATQIITLNAVTPDETGGPKVIIQPGISNIALNSNLPSISSGASIKPGISNIAISSLVPSDVGPLSDPYFSNVLILLHMDGVDNGTSFIDSSSYGNSIFSSGTSLTKTSVKKYGTASLRGSGSNSLVFAPIDLFSQFTLEAWVYADSITADMAIFGRASGNIQLLRFNGDGTGKLMSYSNGTLFPGNSSDLAGMTSNTWYHVAMTRSGNTVRTYINGIVKQVNTSFTGSISIDRVGVGYSGDTSFWVGYIDDVRITNGVDRYGGSNFTPPAMAFPNS